MQVTPIPKQKPFRSKKAIEWFRTQECYIEHCTGMYTNDQVTGHHEPLNGHGMSTKGPDDEQVPLSLKHHKEREDILGRKKFYKKYGIENWREVVEYYKKEVHKYLDEEMNNNGRLKNEQKK